MALPTSNTSIVQTGKVLLIQAFQKPNIQAFLSAHLDELQQIEAAVTDPIVGYLQLIQLANAGTETLDLYGKIVDYPRGALDNDNYRVFVGINTLSIFS